MSDIFQTPSYGHLSVSQMPSRYKNVLADDVVKNTMSLAGVKKYHRRQQYEVIFAGFGAYVRTPSRTLKDRLWLLSRAH